MDLRINRCRKYVTWNVVSVLGYVGVILGIIFAFMFMIASSGVGVSAEVSEYFYSYIVKHLISPYLGMYKFQLIVVGVMLICSVYENSYYVARGEYGLRLFVNNERLYSILFVTGICLNFLPMYIFFVFVVSNLMRLI